MSSIQQTYIPVVFLFILLAPFTGIQGQKELREANKLFETNNYCECIPLYSKYLNAFVDRNALVKRGRAYFHCNQLTESIEDFKNAMILNYQGDDIDYYLATSYQHNHDFELAIEHYKVFLSKNLKNDFVRERITEKIKRCANGIALRYTSTGMTVENFGNAVNSPANEINMIQSPVNPERYYFSKSDLDDKARYQIMNYTAREASWMASQVLSEGMSSFNQVIAGLSLDGQQLYFSRFNDKKQKSTLLTDRYVPGELPFSNIRFFEGPVKYELGDRDIFVVNDSTFLFSSSRFEGYGGYDIYLTGYSNGYWYEPVNLGENVNSPFDEITPSMNQKGNTLYFSSDHLGSMGGFDVFRSSFSDVELKWDIPENPGFPLNSAGNDINYKLTDNEMNALISSDRKTEGFGGFDIYRIRFEESIAKDPEGGLETFLASITTRKAYQKYNLEVKNAEIHKDLEPLEDSLLLVTAVEPDFEDSILESAISSTQTPEELTPSDREGLSTIQIKPLYYDMDLPVLGSESQKDYINSLIDILLRYPALSIKMMVHCTQSNSNWDDLNLKLDLLLPIVKYMADEGVSPDHILIASSGSNLPVAKENVSGRLSAASTRFNNRIHFTFINKDDLLIEYEKPFVVQHLRENDWYLYQSVTEGLAYKIQIDVQDETAYDLVSEIVPYGQIEMDIFTREKIYYFGIYTRYDQAVKAASTVLDKTGINATVSAFVSNIKVNDSNILEFAKSHTDLINYMEASK